MNLVLEVQHGTPAGSINGCSSLGKSLILGCRGAMVGRCNMNSSSWGLDGPLRSQMEPHGGPKIPWIDPCAAKWNPTGDPKHPGSTPAQPNGVLRGAQIALDRPLRSQMEPYGGPKSPWIDPCTAKWRLWGPQIALDGPLRSQMEPFRGGPMPPGSTPAQLNGARGGVSGGTEKRL